LKTRSRRFGFDLDNTIVDYSASVERYCFDNALQICKTIEELRALLQEIDDSGYHWQIAQGWLYTDGLSYAKPADGVIDLCEYLKARNFKLFIISHKTTHTPVFCGYKELRGVATKWISSRGLSKYFVDTENIFFEATRNLKIKRIQSLSLHYFVDDLVQIFQDPSYPKKIVSFLLSTKSSNLSWVHDVTSFMSIQEILDNEK
jgi:fermentation-respiration switch protein FrsA (DUF1100 family)